MGSVILADLFDIWAVAYVKHMATQCAWLKLEYPSQWWSRESDKKSDYCSSASQKQTPNLYLVPALIDTHPPWGSKAVICLKWACDSQLSTTRSQGSSWNVLFKNIPFQRKQLHLPQMQLGRAVSSLGLQCPSYSMSVRMWKQLSPLCFSFTVGGCQAPKYYCLFPWSIGQFYRW